jgi:protease I
MGSLHDFVVALLLTDGFEEGELLETRKALATAGARVDIVSPKAETQGFQKLLPADRILTTRALENVAASDYDALLICGGLFCGHQLRNDAQALALVREFQSQGKPIAATGYAVCVLASAGLIAGRRIAAPPSLRDDLLNAGAECPSRSVVIDRNWITVREDQDLTLFNREMIALFSRATPSVIQVSESA